MIRFDWLNFAVWAFIGAVSTAIWAAVIIALLWPFGAGALDAIGKLNGCEALSAAECSVFAAEGR